MMYWKEEISPTEVVLKVSGNLMGSDTPVVFHEKLEEAISGNHSTITLNLKEVIAINSSNIGQILLFRKRLEEENRILRIKGCSENLYKTFLLIKAEDLMSIEK